MVYHSISFEGPRKHRSDPVTRYESSKTRHPDSRDSHTAHDPVRYAAHQKNHHFHYFDRHCHRRDFYFHAVRSLQAECNARRKLVSGDGPPGSGKGPASRNILRIQMTGSEPGKIEKVFTNSSEKLTRIQKNRNRSVVDHFHVHHCPENTGFNLHAQVSQACCHLDIKTFSLPRGCSTGK